MMSIPPSIAKVSVTVVSAKSATGLASPPSKEGGTHGSLPKGTTKEVSEALDSYPSISLSLARVFLFFLCFFDFFFFFSLGSFFESDLSSPVDFSLLFFFSFSGGLIPVDPDWLFSTHWDARLHPLQ